MCPTPHDPRPTHFLFCIWFLFLSPEAREPHHGLEAVIQPLHIQGTVLALQSFLVVGWKEGTPVHHITHPLPP
jgi:hypothetical protein